MPRNLTEGYHRSSTSADAAVQNLPVWTTVAVVHPVKRGAGGHVGVVGAGVAGMAAAIRLAEAGLSVSVFDPAPAAGGLAGGFSVGGGSVERFYHHIFHSDKTSQRWINDLGLGAHLEWLPASMGFYSGGNLYRFGTPLSLLAFRPLSVVDRVRMGLRIRGLSSQPSPDPFEEITAVEWLRQRCSERELEVFWHPMLEAKFGPDSDAVSMAWLWARFRARVGGSAGLRERLGYLRGGFQQLGDRMADRALELGVEVHFGSRVREVQIDEHGVAALSDADGRRFAVDAIVWTPSLNALARAVPALRADYREVCAGIRYHHAVVMVVELERSALPYYWVTVGDRRLPFTVAVEHTRLVGTTDYSGRTIVYLGRYSPPDDPIVSEADESVRERFLGAAADAFSEGFRHPLAAHLFRAPAAQPIVPPGWGRKKPSLRTGLRGLVTANIAQIYPWDRGINYSIELGEQAAKAVLDELEVPTSAAAALG